MDVELDMIVEMGNPFGVIVNESQSHDDSAAEASIYEILFIDFECTACLMANVARDRYHGMIALGRKVMELTVIHKELLISSVAVG